MHWSIFDFDEKTLRGETVRWSDYNDDFWWDNVSVSDQFQVRVGPKTGNIYRLNPRTGEVAVTPPASAACACGHAAEAHDSEGCNSHVSALLPDATMAMACTCAAYTPAPAGEQEGEHDGN